MKQFDIQADASMRVLLSAALLTILLSQMGCGLPALARDPKQLFYLTTPTAAHSRYFEVVSAGFLINAKERPVIVRYGLSMRVREPKDTPRYLTVEYDDPQHRSQRLVQSAELPAGAEEISLESSPVGGLQPGWSYWVRVKAYADPARTQEVDRLTQRIQSIVDWSLLQQRGLVPDASGQ